jgi:methyl-accepting chemotaxis protein
LKNLKTYLNKISSYIELVRGKISAFRQDITEGKINITLKRKVYFSSMAMAIFLSTFGSYYIINNIQMETGEIVHLIISVIVLVVCAQVALYYIYDYSTKHIAKYQSTGENAKQAYGEALRFPLIEGVSIGITAYSVVLGVMAYMSVVTDMGRWDIFNIFVGGFIVATPYAMLGYFMTQEFFRPLVRKLFTLADVQSLTEIQNIKISSIGFRIMLTFFIVATNALVGFSGYLFYTMFQLGLEESELNLIFYEMLIVSLFNLGFAIFFGIMLSKNITYSLKQIEENLEKMATSTGDLSKKAIISANDEVGIVSGWFNKFLSNIRNLVLEVRTASNRISEIGELISSSYEQIKISAQEVTTVIDTVADGAETQVENVSEVVTISKEIEKDAKQILTASQNVEKIVEKAGKASLESSEKSERSVEDITKLVDHTQKMVEAMRELSENIDEIAEIAETIKNISTQTNLLSLNAAIESARAGEAGEGFGVIAQEIRSLNEDTNEAAMGISDLISQIQSFTQEAIHQIDVVSQEVNSGKETIETSRRILQEISQSVHKGEKAVKDITKRSQSQEESLQNIISLIEETTVISEANAGATQQIAASSTQQVQSVEEMSNSAQVLTRYAMQLQSLMNRFKV